MYKKPRKEKLVVVQIKAAMVDGSRHLQDQESVHSEHVTVKTPDGSGAHAVYPQMSCAVLWQAHAISPRRNPAQDRGLGRGRAGRRSQKREDLLDLLDTAWWTRPEHENGRSHTNH